MYFINLLSIILNFFIQLFIYGAKNIKEKAELRLKNPYEPLPDIIHDNIPVINFYMPDKFILLLIILVIINIYSLNDLYKNFICMLICLIIRAFVIRFTILPSCIPLNIINKKQSFYDKMFLSSHDLMFSGHTIYYFFFGNILNLNIIKVIGSFLSIASRQHYTIDVFVAGIIYNYVYLLIK